MQNYNSIVWDGIIKKEARGSNDEDLGEVQEIGDTYVLTQKGCYRNKNSIFQSI
jgi:hypothetical protein